jgi:radical SAM superfamily enzyme YgiQ (UPF0313 family)
VISLGGYFPLVSYAVQSRGPVLSGLRLDNGIALIASYLKERGYKPIIFDYNNTHSIEHIRENGKSGFLEHVVGELDDFISHEDVKAIGFKLYNNGFKDSVSIAEELKKRNPGVALVAGGPQVKWFRENIFTFTDAFDVLSYGDGDSFIGDFADLAYEGRGDITSLPKVVYKDNGRVKKTSAKDVPISLDSIQYPLYTDDVYLRKDGKIQIPVIEDSRGCSNKCTFCVHPSISGRKRVRSIQEVVEEMNLMNAEYGFSVFRLSGSSPPSEYVNQLAEEMPDGLLISSFGCSDSGYDYAGLKGKFLGVFIGLESADPRILKDFDKTDDVKTYLEKVSSCISGFREEGISTLTSMIIPSPDETYESMENSFEFLCEANPDFVPVLPIAPMPGSRLTKRIQRGAAEGIKIDDDYMRKMMLLEFDNLQPPRKWPKVPWDVRVNGEWFENPFNISDKFIEKLKKRGMHPLSDDLVLMTYLYNNGLSEDQEKRREECIGFMKTTKERIMNEPGGIGEIVDQINKNQGISNG